MMDYGNAGGATVSQGPNLEVIQTEALGFLSLAGDAKVQLTPKWQILPSSTASLLSIASRKGLVAAAGPDGVYVATTESVRKALATAKTGDSEFRAFRAQAKLPLTMRISQLAFTADEKYLVLSAESGGGLAVYDVDSLVRGGTGTAFELNTNGETLRALVPNPMPETAGLCAVVTTNGNLFMANLKDGNMVSGANGLTLRNQTSCATWSTKGKQMVAGMADGTLVQMTPDGAEKGLIPKPPSLGNYHVSSVSWLENHLFLVVHNPTNGTGQVPSQYHIITRQQSSRSAPSFTFQKLSVDPVEAFGSEKVPHHSVLRLKDFAPSLTDMLLVTSTSTESIGLLTRSKTPLASDKSAEAITNVFTTTELADDTKRAQLPISGEGSDTFPIGVSIDLSGRDKVTRPIPTDEMEESPGPVPGFWALNNEGVLSCWWIIYNESIRTGTIYSSLAAAEQGAVPKQSARATSGPGAGVLASHASAPAFGSNASTMSLFAGAGSGAPAFGQPAFGGTSALGARFSPWTSGSTAAAHPAFGSSSFASTANDRSSLYGSSAAAPLAFERPSPPAFGQASSMGGGFGAKASSWATGSTASTNASVFGQSGFVSAAPGSGNKTFGGGSLATPSSRGFASLAGSSPFCSLSGNVGGTSVFASQAAAIPAAPDVAMNFETAFPSKNGATSALGSTPFVLGSTFKADSNAAKVNEKPKQGGSSLFGGGFALSLDSAAKDAPVHESKDEDMTTTPAATEDKPTPSISGFTSLATTAAASQDKPESFLGASTTVTIADTPTASLFGSLGTATPTPLKFDLESNAPGQTSGSGLFGSFKPSATNSISGTSKPTDADTQTATHKIKEEDAKENIRDIPSAPLPPDSTTSKPGTPAKEIEQEGTPPSSFLLKSRPEPEPAPLLPDLLLLASESKVETKASLLIPAKAAPESRQKSRAVPSVPDSAGVSESSEDEASEDESNEQGTDEGSEEGSGVDVTKDLSPSTSGLRSLTPGHTPQGSVAAMAGSVFSTASRPEQKLKKKMFVGPPIQPLGYPRTIASQSLRSPSPVRGLRSQALTEPEGTRSASAPGVQSALLGAKRSQVPKTPVLPPLMALDPNVVEQRRQAAKQREAEEHVLVDPEDEGIQEILGSEVEPTLRVNEFLAGEDNIEALESRSGGKKDVPDACEVLWRGINRMIDRLGLNSRSLKSFVLGHTTIYKLSGRSKEDLEDADDWVLFEAVDLGYVLEGELARKLDEGRIKDGEITKRTITSLGRDLAKLRARVVDMGSLMALQTDPDQLAMARSLPLSAEQATQQTELRRAYASFTKLLSEAEEALTLLRAKIASAAGGAKTTVPTVDAVLRTIGKMTSMAEKRSGDVDVLETQMRRLGIRSPASNGAHANSPGSAGSAGTRSRELSPFLTSVLGTPSKFVNRRSLLILSPDQQRLRESTAGLMGWTSATTSPHRKTLCFSEVDKKKIRDRNQRRAYLMGLLKKSLERSGGNVQRMEDDD